VIGQYPSKYKENANDNSWQRHIRGHVFNRIWDKEKEHGGAEADCKLLIHTFNCAPRFDRVQGLWQLRHNTAHI
jgi:hypothetical protein